MRLHFALGIISICSMLTYIGCTKEPASQDLDTGKLQSANNPRDVTSTYDALFSSPWQASEEPASLDSNASRQKALEQLAASDVAVITECELTVDGYKLGMSYVEVKQVFPRNCRTCPRELVTNRSGEPSNGNQPSDSVEEARCVTLNGQWLEKYSTGHVGIKVDDAYISLSFLKGKLAGYRRTDHDLSRYTDLKNELLTVFGPPQNELPGWFTKIARAKLGRSVGSASNSDCWTDEEHQAILLSYIEPGGVCKRPDRRFTLLLDAEAYTEVELLLHDAYTSTPTLTLIETLDFEINSD